MTSLSHCACLAATLFCLFMNGAEGLVADGLEPFLRSTQGLYVQDQDKGYWTAKEGPYDPIRSHPNRDIKTSRFYPVAVDTKKYGTVTYFLCGGGTNSSALTLDASRTVSCQHYTPGEPYRYSQLFHTFDAPNGTVLMRPVKSLFLLTMKNEVIALGRSSLCKDRHCKFNLIYPPSKPAEYRVLEIKADASRVKMADYHYVVVDTFKFVNRQDIPSNFSRLLNEMALAKEVTTWNERFAWNLTVLEKTKIPPRSRSITIRGDFARGTSVSDEHTRQVVYASVWEMLPPMSVSSYVVSVKTNYDAVVPFRAKIKMVEFDAVTGQPLYSAFGVEGTWRGTLYGSAFISTDSRPINSRGT